MMEMDFNVFKLRLHKQLNLDFSGYRDNQLQRRLNTYMQRRNIPNYPALLRFLMEHPQEAGSMRDYLAINVSEFFRNPEMFRYLSESVIPVLAEKEHVSMWSAGCSIGCEAYSLGILASELLNGRTWAVKGTDIDGEALSAARAGIYSRDDVKAVPKHHLKKYFTSLPQDRYEVIDSLKNNIRFVQQDLFKDSYPMGMDLILCRNVVIYFTEEAKTDIFAKMSKSLRPGGVLFIGSTESFHNYQQHQLNRLHPCFYQRI